MVSLALFPEAHRTLIWDFLATNTHPCAMWYTGNKSNTTGIHMRPTVHDLHWHTRSKCSLSQTDYTISEQQAQYSPICPIHWVWGFCPRPVGIKQSQTNGWFPMVEIPDDKRKDVQIHPDMWQLNLCVGQFTVWETVDNSLRNGNSRSLDPHILHVKTHFCNIKGVKVFAIPLFWQW